MLPSLLTLALLFAAPPASAELRSVVSTIFPLASLAQGLLEPSTDVTVLLPAGANPHTFEPAPQHLAAVERADCVLEVGGGLDNWVQKLLRARSRPPAVFTLTAVTPLLPAASDEARGSDPHLWLDPIRMRDHALPALARLLGSLDPQHRTQYEERQRRLEQKLSALDLEIAATLAPVRGRAYVALHSAWRYFAARYGLVEAATLEPFPGKELSAREMVAIARQIQASGAKVLLVEPGLFSRLATQVAAESGLRLVALDPYGHGGQPGFDRYETLLRTTAQGLAEALR